MAGAISNAAILLPRQILRSERGRFVSEDPIGFVLGTNFYRYAVNSPTLLTRLDWAGGSPLDWKDFGAFR